MNLFNITHERKLLMQQLEAADGEASEELLEELAINRSNFEEKAEGYAYMMRKLETDVNAVKSEIDRLTALKTAKERAYERLEKTLLDAVVQYGEKGKDDVARAEVGTFRFSTRRNPASVEILDEEAIPEEYKVSKTTVSVSKTTIKNALSLGQSVPGAQMKEGDLRLVVK